MKLSNSIYYGWFSFPQKIIFLRKKSSVISPYNDEYFMKQAFQEAQKAFEKDEVPVGAFVVANNQIIARAHNFTEHLHDVTAHA